LRVDFYTREKFFVWLRGDWRRVSLTVFLASEFCTELCISRYLFFTLGYRTLVSRTDEWSKWQKRACISRDIILTDRERNRLIITVIIASALGVDLWGFYYHFGLSTRTRNGVIFLCYICIGVFLHATRETLSVNTCVMFRDKKFICKNYRHCEDYRIAASLQEEKISEVLWKYGFSTHLKDQSINLMLEWI